MPKRISKQKFKKGDRVEAIEDNGKNLLKKGKKYHISDIEINVLGKRVVRLKEISYWWNENNFKLCDDKYKGLIGTKGMF